MVGKFQLYWQIYNILVAFLLNKTLSITAIFVAPFAWLNWKGKSLWDNWIGIASIRILYGVIYTLCVNVHGPWQRKIYLYKSEHISTWGLMHSQQPNTEEEKKKWLLSFSIFIIIILWATCFSSAPVLSKRMFFFLLNSPFVISPQQMKKINRRSVSMKTLFLSRFYKWPVLNGMANHV